MILKGICYATIYILDGKLTLGGLVAFNTYLLKLLNAISKILEINMNKQVVNISYERILSLLEETECSNKKMPIDIIRKIRFKSVYFGYDEKPILRGMTFDIDEPGVYSFVGANGTGKTTILRLIEKLYYSKEGQIKINDVEIQNIDTNVLREKIIYLTKNPFLINTTIFENMQIGNKNVSMREIVEVCKLVGIHDDILKLELGYNSIISDAGKNFSSGQQQKLAFARAYLKKSSMILLDEVTSDIDGKSECDICELIRKLGAFSIVINISHRPLSVKTSKRVFLFKP